MWRERERENKDRKCLFDEDGEREGEDGTWVRTAQHEEFDFHSIGVHVCSFICVYECVYMCMHVLMSICVCAFICVCVCSFIYPCVCVYSYVNMHASVCSYVVCVCIHKCMCKLKH